MINTNTRKIDFDKIENLYNTVIKIHHEIDYLLLRMRDLNAISDDVRLLSIQNELRQEKLAYLSALKAFEKELGLIKQSTTFESSDEIETDARLNARLYSVHTTDRQNEEN